MASTAELEAEILADLEENPDAYTAPVNDVITIDPETKTINLPSSEVLFGTEEEQGVERKYFKCPRIVGDNIDLFTHQIYISYMAVKDKNATFIPDSIPKSYWCDDVALDETGNYITFSWLLSGNVLASRGFVGFAVIAKSVEGDILKTRWKTAPAVGTVLMTLPDAGEGIAELYPDIITQLLDRMDAVEENTSVELDESLTDNTKAAPAGVVGELRGDLANTKANLIEKINLNVSNDEKTKRSLDSLWKLNEGISYQFETDKNRAYQKDVPTGAKLASLKQIGGKTIVWNQMLESLKTGWVAETNVTATFGDETVFSSSVANYGIKANSALSLFKGHKYYVSLIAKRTDNLKTGYSFGGGSGRTFQQVFSFEDADINVYKKFSSINVCNDNIRDDIYIWNTTYPYGDFYVKNPVFIDLTLMFGAGNEPATVEEFEAMFPEDYYEYNEGTLMSAPVNEVVIADMSGTISNTAQLPQAILDLDGYGDSVSDDVYNYVDFENKKYHKRVGKVDLGTLEWYEDGNLFWYTTYLPIGIGLVKKAISYPLSYGGYSDNFTGDKTKWYLNGSGYFEVTTGIENASMTDVQQAMSGVMLYYELAEEEIIDISDILTDGILENLEVEAGGTLTFQNSNGDGYRIPVPNSEKYVISLAEVNQ